jgi:type II secretory pathway pseudopilin PulG
MMNLSRLSTRIAGNDRAGFTLIEVMVAGVLMIILAVGLLSVTSYAVKLNSGNNIRVQAQSALQAEAEYYRSLKFVPVGSDAALNANTYTRPNRVTADNSNFAITVQIINKNLVNGSASNNATATLKEITINATPVPARTGWLANLNTNLTIQRVRAN